MFGDPVGPLQGIIQRLIGHGHHVDQTDGVRLGGVDRAAGQDQFHRQPMADQPRESLGPPVDERNTEPAFVATEGGVGRRHPKVTPQCHLEPACDAVALDRCDRRLADLGSGEPERAVVGVLEVEGLQVGPCREMSACAVQDSDIGVVVRIEPLPGGSQGACSGQIDRIASAGPVDRDDRDSILPLVGDAHRVNPLRSINRMADITFASRDLGPIYPPE